MTWTDEKRAEFIAALDTDATTQEIAKRFDLLTKEAYTIASWLGKSKPRGPRPIGAYSEQTIEIARKLRDGTPVKQVIEEYGLSKARVYKIYEGARLAKAMEESK